MQTDFSSKSNPKEAIQNWLVTQLAEQLSLETDSISVSEPLTRYGLDSIDAVTLVGDLEDALDTELPSTLFWDYPTIEKSAQYIEENHDISALLTKSEEAPSSHGGVSLTDTPSQSQEGIETPEVSPNRGWGGLFGRMKGA